MRVSSLSIRLQRALALAGGAAATLALVLSGLPATAEPCWNGCGEPTVLARSATSASQASVSQTKRNSRQYRRDRAREAARDRSKIRRATRRTYYGRDHQPGGYCIYDAKGKVILRPEGVVC